VVALVRYTDHMVRKTDYNLNKRIYPLGIGIMLTFRVSSLQFVQVYTYMTS
jgi:hypothetical protein